MTLGPTLVQSLVQGLTEFLPVSSSGHLVLVQQFFHIRQPHLTVDVALHAGTFLAVLVYFRRKIISLAVGFFRRPFDRSVGETDYVWKVLVASVPTAVAGLLIEKFASGVFESVVFVLIGMSLTAVMLFVTDLRLGRQNAAADRPSFLSALVIGCFQGFAVLPGISRSGWTMCAGMFCGMSRKSAAEFSFMAGLPALAGALVLEGRGWSGLTPDIILPLVIGALVAFAVALAGIRLLFFILERSRLAWFSLYLVVVVAVSAVILVIRS
jgi:undecaprenyl-diphosphatase